jgi:Protein of unknown function (DUF2441)
MPTYFHCAPIQLAPGAIIECGNWGRILRLYESANNQVPIQALNEMVLEALRLSIAPEKPSRLNCLFVLPNLEEARKYKKRHCPTNLIYSVEPIEPSYIAHLGDYEAVIQAHTGRYFDAALDRFRQYWLSSSPTFPEVLLSCSARVISRADD